jgi:hypothetical protein
VNLRSPRTHSQGAVTPKEGVIPSPQAKNLVCREQFRH